MVTTLEEADGFFTVRQGDRYQDKLCADEALYRLAMIIIGSPDASTFLKTSEEHAAWEAKHFPKPKPLESWEKQLT